MQRQLVTFFENEIAPWEFNYCAVEVSCDTSSGVAVDLWFNAVADKDEVFSRLSSALDGKANSYFSIDLEVGSATTTSSAMPVLQARRRLAEMFTLYLTMDGYSPSVPTTASPTTASTSNRPTLPITTQTTTSEGSTTLDTDNSGVVEQPEEEEQTMYIIIIVIIIVVIVIVVVIVVIVINKNKKKKKNRIIPTNVNLDNKKAQPEEDKKPDIGPGVALADEEMKEFNRLLALPIGEELFKAIQAANAIGAPVVKGADIDMLTTSVHEADHPEVKRQLLSGCCSLPATHDLRDKLFLTAARKGQVETVQMMHAAGANVNTKDRVGNTALHYASMAEKHQLIRFLLDNGAELTENERGEPPKIPRRIFVGGAYKDVEEALRLMSELGASSFSVKKDAQGYCIMDGTCAVTGLKQSDLDHFNTVAQQALIGLAGSVGFSENDTMSSVKQLEWVDDDHPYIMKWSVRYEDASADKNTKIEKLVNEVSVSRKVLCLCILGLKCIRWDSRMTHVHGFLCLGIVT